MSNEAKTILVVDDHDDILEMTAMILSSAGYKVFTAGGYKEFLAQIETVRPDVLVCDIRMPVRDGFWIAEHLETVGIKLPIIYITAHDSSLYRTYAPFVGSVAYMTKPFDAPTLLKNVTIALALPLPQAPSEPTPTL